MMDYFRECECKKSYGFYEKDGLNAVAGGEAVPLGIANPSLLLALQRRPEEGLGSTFDAFVIPVNCPTVKHQ
jgi:hypothetical protein